MVIQDKNPNFLLKASHPQNNFFTFLCLDFIETVFMFLSQNTFVHTITHSHARFMLFCNEKHETVLNTPMFCVRTQDFSSFMTSLIHILCFQVKYLISQLFLLLVFLPSCMYVVSLNEKYICRSHNNSFGTRIFHLEERKVLKRECS